MTTTDQGAAARGHHLRVRGAGKSYGATRALSAVDFDVEPGQFLVLLGPSGSGKSTLIRSLAGVERLDEGQIHLSGQLVSDRRRHLAPERRDLAMVFQDYALWPHLSVALNVGYALRRRRCAPQVHHERVAAALDRVGLSHLAGRYPSELSGGEQQRVALARAVVAEPGLLLFDEPLSNLDADLRERLRVEISTLTRACGATAVYITHDQSEAFALADRIGVLDQGRLVQLATPEQLYRRPATPFVARFTGAAGELPGHSLPGGDPERIRVQVGATQLHARPIGQVRAGTKVTVLVRPAATTISDQPIDRTGAFAGEAGCVVGTVADVAYRGRGYDHVVVCPEGTLSAVHSQLPHACGEPVRVRLDPDGCLAYDTGRSADGDTADVTAVRLTAAGLTPQLAASAPSRRNL